VDTTAEFELSAKLQALEEEFGLVTLCAADFFEKPRMFHARDGDDRPLVEDLFAGTLVTTNAIDITTGCGTHFARPIGFSFLMIGRELRTVSEIVDEKLDNFESAITSADETSGGLAGLITKKIRRSILNGIRKARRAHEKGNDGTAVVEMEKILLTVQNSPGSFDDSFRNVRGEIDARARSAIFMLCGATGDPGCSSFIDS
jgi:hypothetical protein